MDNMDLLLKEAFEEIVTEEYENRPLDLPEHRFSLKFRIKMRRLIRRIGTKEREPGEKTSILELYRPIRSRRRLILLIALMLLLLGGTVAAARTLICWLYEISLEQRDDHVKVNREENVIMENGEETAETEKSFRKYKLTKIPEGYHLVSEEVGEKFEEYRVAYMNEEGYALLFRQNGYEDITMGNITYAMKGLEEITVNHFTGYYMEDDNVGSLILSDEETLIELSGKMSKEELLELAEGLELME